MLIYSKQDLTNLVLEHGPEVISELDISKRVFPIPSNLRNKRGLFTFAHATDECKKRTSPFLTGLLFEKPMTAWEEVVNFMITKWLKPYDITKITKLLDSKGVEGEAYIKIQVIRPVIAPDGKKYKGEMSLVLLAAWPSIGPYYAKFFSKSDFKDKSYMIADPEEDPRLKAKIDAGDIIPLGRNSFNNLNLNTWIFVVVGYAGQFSLYKKRPIYPKPADISYEIELEEIKINDFEFEVLKDYSRVTSQDFSYFR